MHTPKRLRAPLLSGTVTIWASRSHVRSNIAEAVFYLFPLSSLFFTLISFYCNVSFDRLLLFLMSLSHSLMVHVDECSSLRGHRPVFPNLVPYTILACNSFSLSPLWCITESSQEVLQISAFRNFSVPKVAGPTRLIYAVNSRGPI